MKWFLAPIAILGSVAIVCAAAPVAHGAVQEPAVYLQTTTQIASPGSVVAISIALDAPYPVNALDIPLYYSSGTLQFAAANTGRSLIDLWRNPIGESAPGMFDVQGGLLTPFRGTQGSVATLYFQVRPNASGTIWWEIPGATVYLANGAATAQVAAPSSITIPISANVPVVNVMPFFGSDRPMIMHASLFRNPGDGAVLLSWDAVDRESGIDGASLRYRTWLLWSDWQTVRNPAVVPTGAWAVTLRVSNNAGVTAMVTRYRWDIIVWKGGLLILLALVGWYLARHGRARHR